jgi:hypothetical protein
MKKIIYIATFFLTVATASFAQSGQPGDGTKLREKLIEYIQQKLDLSKPEAERFSPVFLDYFKELKKTNQDFRGDRLLLQQKIVDLRLRFRDQFKPIIGEKRSNDVFIYEREFINKVKEIRDDRLQNHQEGRSNKRIEAPGL